MGLAVGVAVGVALAVGVAVGVAIGVGGDVGADGDGAGADGETLVVAQPATAAATNAIVTARYRAGPIAVAYATDQTRHAGSGLP